MGNEKNFGIIIKEFEDITFLNLSGYLDAHTAPKLEEYIGQVVESKKYKIIVNFKNLDYISSAGLGVFMAFVEEIRDNKGDIKLTEMNEKVFSIFDLLGFPILFDIVKSDNEAIEKFKNGEIRKNV